MTVKLYIPVKTAVPADCTTSKQPFRRIVAPVFTELGQNQPKRYELLSNLTWETPTSQQASPEPEPPALFFHSNLQHVSRQSPTPTKSTEQGKSHRARYLCTTRQCQHQIPSPNESAISYTHNLHTQT
jgi:hypothetical protein